MSKQIFCLQYVLILCFFFFHSFNATHLVEQLMTCVQYFNQLVCFVSLPRFFLYQPYTFLVCCELKISVGSALTEVETQSKRRIYVNNLSKFIVSIGLLLLLLYLSRYKYHFNIQIAEFMYLFIRIQLQSEIKFSALPTRLLRYPDYRVLIRKLLIYYLM